MFLFSWNTVILLYYIFASVGFDNYLETGYIHRFQLGFKKKISLFRQVLSSTSSRSTYNYNVWLEITGTPPKHNYIMCIPKVLCSSTDTDEIWLYYIVA